MLMAPMASDTSTQNGWSNWFQTDCLKGLDVRVKRGSYNEYANKYRWQVEFRNRYRENIHFSSVGVKYIDKNAIRSSGKTQERLHAKGNGGTVTTWYLIDEPSNIYVYVNKIRISPNDWSADFYNCDL